MIFLKEKMSKPHDKSCETMLFLSAQCTCGADEEFIKERNMLSPINTEEDNEKALANIEMLWDAKRNTKEGDILDKLVTLVLAYENKHYPIPSDTRKFLKKKLFIPYLIPAIFILIILIGLFAGCDIVKCYPEYDINGKIVGVACGGEM